MFDYVFKKKKTWVSVFFLDLIGSLFFLFKSKKCPKEVRKVLIVRLDHLGDIILSAPFYSNIRNVFPGAEIHLLCDKAFAPLFEKDSRIDQVIGLENHWLSKKKRLSVRKLFSLILNLRKEGYDLGFDLRGDIRSIFYLLFLSGVKFRVSYGVRGGGFMLNSAPIHPLRVHEVDKCNALLSTLTHRNTSVTQPVLEIKAERQEQMLEKMKELGRDTSRPLVAAHLGAGYPSKQWDVKKFTTVLNSILQQDKYQIVLIGKENEATLSLDFLKEKHLFNLIGRTDLKQLSDLLSITDYFIGNDSGPAHVAGACGAACLTIFSGTNRHDEWEPKATLSEVVYKDIECSPCEEKVCPLIHHQCMEWIEVEDVLQAFESLVKQKEVLNEKL